MKLDHGKGLSGKGHLTIARIDVIQKFCGLVIRDNKNNQGMETEIWAMLDYFLSTAKHPEYTTYQNKKNIWCSF